jgi:hypothetical protein
MNSIPEALLVYGPKQAVEAFDNSLYSLPAGRKTPNDCECDGFFVPNDRTANQALSSRSGPVAVKYRDYRSPVIEMPSQGKFRCTLNEGIYVSGELNWRIPNLGYSEIKRDQVRFPRGSQSRILHAHRFMLARDARRTIEDI